MPIKKYAYPDRENAKTLKLTLDFGKLRPIKSFEEAYYILSTKGKKKSAYIITALEYEEKHRHMNKEIRRAYQRLKVAHLTKEIFEIDSKEKAENLLSLDESSPQIQTIRSWIPEFKTPTHMLCGFKMNDPKAVSWHEKLYDMSVNIRVVTISEAVVNYVLDGNDTDMDEIMATSFLLAARNEYQHSTEKDKVVERFMTLVNFIE